MAEAVVPGQGSSGSGVVDGGYEVEFSGVCVGYVVGGHCCGIRDPEYGAVVFGSFVGAGTACAAG